MMKHVSMFRVKPEHRTPETIEMLARHLREMPGKEPSIVECEIGVKPFPMPTQTPGGELLFYDLIQIIAFATPDDCMAYPGTQAHRDFAALSDPYMELVAALDYPV